MCAGLYGHSVQYWMYVATGGPNVKWGGTDFKWGARHHWPPAGDDLVHSYRHC